MSTAEPEHKLKKSEVHYSDGHQNSKCGLCKWWHKNLDQRYTGTCTWVQGSIHAAKWCELFKPKRSKT